MNRIAAGFTALVLINILSAPQKSPAAPVIVVNPGQTPTTETWQLREVWRLGGEDADLDEPLLGVISRGVVDKAGNVLLLDTQLAHVLEISPQGEYLQTLGAKGEGPGELQRPQDLTLLSDGTVGLLQGYPARLVRLNRDGTPAGDIATDDPAINFWRVRSAGGVTVVGGQRNDYNREDPTRSVTYRFIRSIDADGAEQHLYLDGTSVTQWQPPVSDESKGFFPSHTWDLTAAGTLVLAPDRDRFQLEFLGPKGDLLRSIERPFEPYVRNEEDLKKVRERMSMVSNGKELDVKKIVLDTEPAINSVTVLYDGSIWIETCYGRRDLPNGISRRYDVLNRDGNLLKEVRLQCDVRPEKDGFRLLADGRFLWVRNLTSAFRSMYPSLQDEAEDVDDDDEDVMLEVILLERVQ